ncbi:MAG: hypothetical protein KKF00_03685 [Proteobacteria bacterium]|nr:hypothetical protein [Pseudomonadota bacterium]
MQLAQGYGRKTTPGYIKLCEIYIAGKGVPDKNLISRVRKSSEDLKKINKYGAESWSARESQPLLGYTQWRKFGDAIKMAITSCKNSGNEAENHFAGAGKMVDIGSESSREVTDYNLSRFA